MNPKGETKQRICQIVSVSDAYGDELNSEFLFKQSAASDRIRGRGHL